MKVLAVRFSAIGDCVMAGYAVNDLRHTYPEAEITWVIEDRCADVISAEKLGINKLALPRSKWRAKGELRTLLEQYRWLTGLRKYGFDYGFDMQGHSKTAWCLRLSGAKKRLSIGATDAVARKLNPVIDDPSLEKAHSVERGRRLISSLLSLESHDSDFLPGEVVYRHSKLVTINVGAGHKAKEIPHDTLRAVGRELTGRGFEVIYLGGPKDVFDAPTGTSNLSGKTTLLESIEWLRKSALHIAGDTGTGHIAAAVGTPLVTIWGHMPIYRFRPYTDQVTVLDKDSIPANASANEIVEAAMRWIA